MRIRSILLIGSLVLAGGCEGAARLRNTTTPRWDAEQVLALGFADGNPAQEFGRITGVQRLSDGRIVVADATSVELRVFDADGAYAQTIGRRGNGPGEFTVLLRLLIGEGDTIVAGSNWLLNLYTSDGTVVGRQQLDWTGIAQPPFSVEYTYPLKNGSFLLMLIRNSTGEPPRESLYQRDYIWVVTRPGSTTVDTLGFFPSLEQMTYTDADGRHTAIPLFPGMTKFAIGDNRVVLGDVMADSVLRYDARNGAREWVKLPLQREPISDSAYTGARAAACDGTSSETARQRCETSLGRVPRQTHYPVFAELAVDASSLWVRTYRPVAGDSAEWLVLGNEGTVIGRVMLPGIARIMQVDGDHAITVTRDDLGVERVVAYRLVREAH